MSEQPPPHLETPEQWTSFLSALVHELRTPLASFRILADLLAESPQNRLGEQERRYAENIKEVAHDIQFLLGEVGELTRMLAGRTVLRPEPVVLEELADRITAEVRPRAWEGGIALSDVVEAPRGSTFRTDATLLKQTLVFLLEYLAGRAKSQLSLRLEQSHGVLRCTLSADGLAFAADLLPSLFVPFQDGVRSSRPRGGRSLVLPLAYEMARALGGTLKAENREGRPTFVLRLAEAAS